MERRNRTFYHPYHPRFTQKPGTELWWVSYAMIPRSHFRVCFPEIRETSFCEMTARAISDRLVWTAQSQGYGLDGAADDNATRRDTARRPVSSRQTRVSVCVARTLNRPGSSYKVTLSRA